MPRKRDKKSPLALFISLLIHVVLFFVLVYMFRNEIKDEFKKLQKVDYEKISSDTLAKAAEKLEKINKDDVADKLEQLQEIEKTLQEIHDEKLELAEELVAENPEEALRKLQDLLPKIIAAQEELHKNMTSSMDAPRKALETIAALEGVHASNVVIQANNNFAADREATAKPYEDFNKSYSQKVTEITKMQSEATKLADWVGIDEITELQKNSQVKQKDVKNMNHDISWSLNQFTQWDLSNFKRDIKRVSENFKNKKHNYKVSYYARFAETYTNTVPAKIETFIDHYDKQLTFQNESIEISRTVLGKIMEITAEEIPEQIPDEVEVTEEITDVDGTTIQYMYNKATEAEKNINRMYKEITAVNLASKARIPLKEAMSTTDIPYEQRKKFENPSEDGRIDSGKEFEKYQTQLETTLTTLQKMVNKSDDMLASVLAEQIREQEGVDAQAFYNKEMELASGANSVAADMTEFMKYGLSEETKPEEDTEESTDTSEPEKTDEPGESSETATKTGDADKGQFPPALMAYAGHSQDGKGTAAYRVMTGNKMLSEGKYSAPWLAVNTWYIIGPFDTKNGTEFGKKFPPENIVDLDSKYIGTGGDVIQWEYNHASGSMVGMPNVKPMSVYYAYTEIEFDEDRDLWVGIASDDGSKMWVNNQLVWIGVYNPKEIAWKFAIGTTTDGRKAYFNHKGFRKLHFHKGMNKVLIRIDNTIGGCAFSFIISTNPNL